MVSTSLVLTLFLACFLPAGDQLLQSDAEVHEAEENLVAWIAELSAILNSSMVINLAKKSMILAVSEEFMNTEPAVVAPFPLLILKKVMEPMMLFSGVFADQRHLLDSSAPKLICTEDYLDKVTWNPLKIFNLLSYTLPFHFDGQAFCTSMVSKLLPQPRTYVVGHSPSSF